MKRILYLCILCLAAGSCSREKEFTIQGQVGNAAGKTLYLEQAGIANARTIDSARLSDDGKFRFRQPAVSAPEFFRLRLGGQLIGLAVDSTETVTIDAHAADFGTGYTVSGSSESDKIKTVTLEGLNLKARLMQLNKDYTGNQINAQEYSDALKAAIDGYKAKVTPFIFENPRSAVAYFTLFQRINGLLIFDPYDKTDYRAYGAVATSWDTFHNGTDRSKQLTQIALSALSTHRGQKAAPSNMPEVREQNQIEIVLPDINGKQIKLSDMKGKVVLLDFTAYESDYSGPYNIALAKLYDKYREKGFEIYQVSLDTDENFWKVTASNLPWISVRDKESVYSVFARSYNVTSLPTSFLLDRGGAIVSRGNNLKDLENTIGKLL